jgi:hypothetical protein
VDGIGIDGRTSIFGAAVSTGIISHKKAQEKFQPQKSTREVLATKGTKVTKENLLKIRVNP